MEAGLVDRVLLGDMTYRDAAERIGMSAASVSRAVARIRERGRDRLSEVEVDRAGLLYDPDVSIDDNIERFARFRTRMFTDTSGRPYIVKGFHRVWIRSLITSLRDGSRSMVLSPPRHGKTSLLAHLMVWLIVSMPNIRIMWVGGNKEIAAEAVNMVKAHLEDNDDLIAAFSPEQRGFRPDGRQGGYWASDGFTVSTRTVVGIKSPTMIAVGRSGKILSRDCDIIIADDIEDQESTQSPTTRSRTRTWVTNTLESRKEDHTAFFVIGSRQHPDDVYGYLLDDPQWDATVDAAHDPDCRLDPADIDIHVDCMLMPEIRSFRWLTEKRDSAIALNNGDHFDMVYLQVPVAEGLQIFTRELCEPARNPNRGLGVPDGCIPIAGLDPAATGYQAAVVWAIDPSSGIHYLADVDNRRGGGIAEAHRTFRWGLEVHGVYHWVVEDNGFQRAIRQDRDIREWATYHGVYLEGHVTGTQKADPHFGVGSMSKLFAAGKIDLPYGTAEARAKTDMFLKQAYQFTDDGAAQRKRLSDVLMAAWFPMKAIRRTLREQQARVNVDYEPMFGGYQMSEWNQAPW